MTEFSFEEKMRRSDFSAGTGLKERLYARLFSSGKKGADIVGFTPLGVDELDMIAAAGEADFAYAQESRRDLSNEYQNNG